MRVVIEEDQDGNPGLRTSPQIQLRAGFEPQLES